MFYQDVFRAFDERGIRYLVVGALAINLHGAPRMTADLDIMADLGRDNPSRLLKTLAELGYRLIAMKRAAGRQQDLNDIETLERIVHFRQGGPEHAK